MYGFNGRSDDATELAGLSVDALDFGDGRGFAFGLSKVTATSSLNEDSTSQTVVPWITD